jgi:hypothetical protein
MAFEIAMKIGTQPYGRMHIKHARKPPAVGARVYVRRAGLKRGRWERVIIDRYLEDMSYCFAHWE